MKKARMLLVAVLSLSLAVGLFGLTACNSGGGVAATVNGTEIPEQEVTDVIEAMRAQSEDYSDPVKWASALAASSYTPESLRETVINSKAREIVLTQEAEAQGFTADFDGIDAQIAQTKETIGGDDATWLETLQQYGYQTEEAYRDMLIVSDLQNQLYEAFSAEPTDEELKEFIGQNPTAVEGWSLDGGAATTDDATADATTEGTEGAEGTADEAAANAEETPAADDSAVSEEPAESQTPSEDSADLGSYAASLVDLSVIPTNVLAEYRELWSESNKGARFNDWTEELVNSADIVINDMPADVPYNVDMSLAESTDGTDTSTDSTSDQPTADEQTPTSYSSAEAVSAAIASGLVVEDTLVGDGDEALDGDTVKVLYTGTLEDGTVFDSTANRDNEPFSFTLGQGGVIRGWDAGVVGMKVGGKRMLTIPSSLAYGDTDNGSIPAGSTLTFEVELVEVIHPN